jgi:anti-sigma regulatory factor (Ser/Thr protein kinase)
MGFAFMEAFMDGLEVESEPMKGTRVYMWKNFDDKLSDMI